MWRLSQKMLLLTLFFGDVDLFTSDCVIFEDMRSIEICGEEVSALRRYF